MLQSTQTDLPVPPPLAGYIIVTITAQHIATGLPVTHNRCPIALALNDLWPQLAIAVDNNYIEIGDGGPMLALSILLQAWITSFDSDRRLGPITIQLDFDHNLAHVVYSLHGGPPAHG